METRNDRTPAFEKLLIPATVRPGYSQEDAADLGLEITVVFTSAEATLSALGRAGALAHGLLAKITLVAPQVVPYPLPLTSPPVLLDFTEERLRTLANVSPMETLVRIYLCRDRFDALAMMLKPRSVLILGTKKRWWPTPEERLAKKLRKVGHQVIVTETE